ncbi:MAG TPA: immunoglobulin domain-containing protein, partial [Anaerohalosphaeraceae bacterium]|nr:immunoglobulin domain-containing protein [Anaerohalosphaeraceae bacterium]
PAGMLPLTAPQTYTWALELYRYPDWDPNQTTEPNQLVRADLYRFMTSSVPTVNTSPADQYKFPAETAVFTAVFNAISPVTGAVWYKDGQALNPADPDVTIAITNGTGDLYTVTLTLANVETADDGAYTCVAENVGGSSAPTEAAYLVIKRPIAYWPLEGNADDAVNGYDGTLLGSPVFEAGKVGQAMVFDGLNDWIDLPDGFANFRSGLTFTVWAKPTATASWARFFDFGNGADAGNIYFSRNGTGADLTFSTLGGSVTASGVLALNEWQWFAVTVDETGNAVIYKNGVSVQTGTVTIPAVVTRTSNFLGKSNWAADALYKGLMDEIRLYNYALTADEIATLYADVAGPFCRTSLSYDLNKDCVVDLQDVAKLAEQWLTCGYWPSPCPPLP